MGIARMDDRPEVQFPVKTLAEAAERLQLSAGPQTPGTVPHAVGLVVAAIVGLSGNNVR